MSVHHCVGRYSFFPDGISESVISLAHDVRIAVRADGSSGFNQFF